MKNFRVNWYGENPDKPEKNNYFTSVGTSYKFFIDKGGELIAKRLIPVQYVGVL